MLVNPSLAIRYGPSLRSGPNPMVLVKGLPTYTYNLNLSVENQTFLTDQNWTIVHFI